jgi:hypothetical protein
MQCDTETNITWFIVRYPAFLELHRGTRVQRMLEQISVHLSLFPGCDYVHLCLLFHLPLNVLGEKQPLFWVNL